MIIYLVIRLIFTTFARTREEYTPTITDCYYTLSLDFIQGTKAYVLTNQPANLGTAGTAYNVSGITHYTNGLSCTDKYYVGTVGFYNAQSNTALISELNNGNSTDVQLTDRTLYKDGKWNTLCLPFNATKSGPLANANIMELDVTSTEEDGTTYKTRFDSSTGTLYLNFKTAESIVAGKPYIVKWESGSDEENPAFNAINVSNIVPVDNIVSNDGTVQFVGTYNYQSYTEDNKSILFLGEGNTLYNPESGANIGAFRAYFQLNGIEAGNPSTGIRAFNLNFGDEETMGISLNSLTPYPSPKGEGSIYSLDGRKLSGKPTKKGMYIYNGKVVVIK